MRTPDLKRFPLRFTDLFGLLLAASVLAGEAVSNAAPAFEVPYGNNAKAGVFVPVNGIKVYYESYGNGPPLLAIHGNGQSLRAMAYQIQFFSREYKVIAADNRGHGKSEMGKPPLTYEQMAEDFNGVLEKLHLKSVFVLGWSDGGILGLLLAIHHPDKVGKLAIMGANLEPSAAEDWALKFVAEQEKIVDEKLAAKDDSQPWSVMKQYLGLLRDQPHIPLSDLQRISAPTLVMAGDKDVIRNEHTLKIFENIPKAHLCIFPGATHMISRENPKLFNETVERFFKAPFTRPDTKDLFLK